MKTLLSIFILLITVGVSAQTYIYNKQEVYGTWNSKGSPYIIKGEAIVPKGKTLKIKPGVEIRFKTGTNRDYDIEGFDVGFLRVNGNVLAKGKEGKTIQFTKDGYGFWGCVYINSAHSKNKFEYCTFQNGYFIRSIIPSDNATGVLTFNNSGGKVLHCLFVNNGWNGINCKNNASPFITNVTVSASNYAFECNTNSTPVVENSIFYGNQEVFYLNGASKPTISYSLLEVDELPYNVIDGGGNILNTNPMFNDSKKNDYKLNPASPCIKKGKSGKNMGAF